MAVSYTHLDVYKRQVHGRVKEAGHHAEDHGVDDEAQKEDQAGQQEAVEMCIRDSGKPAPGNGYRRRVKYTQEFAMIVIKTRQPDSELEQKRCV